MTLNLLAVGIVVLNIAVALGLYYLWNDRVELPMMVGILYGAVTNTPGLGAANEALNQLHYTGPQIALGYACAYPLGGRYHWFYHCYPLHLPCQYGERRRKPENPKWRFTPQTSHDEPGSSQ